jgi:hypothetical protein
MQDRGSRVRQGAASVTLLTYHLRNLTASLYLGRPARQGLVRVKMARGPGMFPRTTSRASFLRSIFTGNFLSKVYRSFLMSVPMTDDIDKTRYLKGLELRNPVRICSTPALGILILTCQGKDSGDL